MTDKEEATHGPFPPCGGRSGWGVNTSYPTHSFGFAQYRLNPPRQGGGETGVGTALA